MLVILVCLNSGISQSSIISNILWFPQITITAVKATGKQSGQVNLTAGGGQGEKVEVVDMDVAAVVSAGVFRVEYKHLVKCLSTLRAIFEHGSHGGVAVDIGIFTLDIVFRSAFEGKIFVNLHQLGVHLTHAGTLCAVEDVFFGSAGVTIFDQHLFHHVLNLFHRR